MLPFILLAAALAGAWALRRLARTAAVGSAYKAKALCTGVFGCGFDLNASSPEVAEDAYKILKPFKAAIDRDNKSVTASLFGFFPRTAVHRPGLGATLALGPLRQPGRVLQPSPVAADWEKTGASAAIERLLEKAFEEPDPKKLRRTRAVAVALGGKLVAERYAPHVKASTPLPGWSMTKAVTSALVGLLAGDNKLALSKKSLLPQWTDGRSAIALEDLLRMRSGLRFSEKYSDPLSDVVQMLYVRPDAAGYAASRPLAHPPGEHWQYASGTTNILSLLVRNAIGEENYAAFPRRALFDPLNMPSAYIEPDAAGTFLGSSYMLATPRDWLRFGQLYAQHGLWNQKPLLPMGWTAFSATPTPQSPDGRYGAHWWLKLPKELGGGTPADAKIPPDAMHALGHEGQCLTVIPSRGLVILRLGLSIYIDAWDHAAFVAGVLDAL